VSEGFSFNGGRTMQAGGQDYRYRIHVMLLADKRPSYWEFYCIKCKQKICELSGQVIYISDSNDISQVEDNKHVPIEYKCSGKYCKIYYSFTLG
jgi:hypothetical protein